MRLQGNIKYVEIEHIIRVELYLRLEADGRSVRFKELRNMKMKTTGIANAAIFWMVIMMIWPIHIEAQSQTSNAGLGDIGNTTAIPMTSEPMAITSGPNEHLFATYYAINS